MRPVRAPRVSPLADLNPLQLPEHNDADDLIGEFLQQPVDSRFEGSSRLSDEPLPHVPVSPTRRRAARPKTAAKQVVFDWDSSIRTISDKYLRERPRARNAGLPDIARREMASEEVERRRRYFRLELPDDDGAGLRRVFPLRKNEIPNVRIDPGILRPRRRRR
jgi:hypothetical protein